MSRGLHQAGRTPRSSGAPAPRQRRRFLCYGLVLFLFSAVVFSSPVHGALESRAAAATPSVICPGGVSQCVTVTIPCQSSVCPQITAGPTLDIGNSQYVYLSGANFPAGDEVRIAYCPIAEPPVIYSTGNPACALGVDAEQVNLSPIESPVSKAGDFGASFPTQVDLAGQDNAPLTASRLVSISPPDADDQPSFYCDDSPNFCGLEVEMFPFGDLGTTETTSNTAIIPLSFSSSASGCPSKDPLVFTDSSYSLEHFIPAADDSTCTESSGVSDVNTATDTDQVIQDFADGGTKIAFTDDPQDPDQASELSKLKYEYIPVSVSATVVAFLGGDYERDPIQAAYPISSYDLTPNMVSGLVTSNYSQGYGSDVLVPPLSCKVLAGCGTTTSADNYDTFDYLNPVSPPVNGPIEYGMFFSSTASGASYQVTNWMCSAPNTPFTVTVQEKQGSQRVSVPVQVTDRNVASKTIDTAPTAGVAWPPLSDPNAPWPFSGCHPYTTIPVLSGSTGQYSFAETPALQAKALRGFAYGGGGSPATLSGGQSLLGFGAMDWSEATYFGLNSANLQDAAGAFVGPSEQSIDAALSDATTASDGVLQYNYDDTTDSSAYPMPQVTYALVSTAAQTPAASQAEGDLLTNLVCYSHSGGTVPLPPGYVPLPDTLFSNAIKQIASTFPYTEGGCDGKVPPLPTGIGKGTTGHTGVGHTGGGPTSTQGGGSTNPGSGVASGQPGSNPSSGAANPSGTGPTTGGSGPATKSGGHTAPGSGSRPSGTTPAQTPGPPPKSFEPTIVALAEGTERWIVAGLGGAALLGLLVGPLVVLAPRARRRIKAVRGASS
jgi:hypothetical protein